MRLSKSASALAAALALSILLAVLLSPLGFESRPSSGLTLVGYVAIGTVVAGVLLDLASSILLFLRTRLASVLAMIGSILLIFPNVADRMGVFFSLPAPPVVIALEYAFLAVLVVTLLLSRMVYRESRQGQPSSRGA